MTKLESILQEYKDGKRDMENVLNFLRKLPYENLSFARVDHHRGLRRGHPEVIYGEGKTAGQVADIIRAMEAYGSNILATRIDAEKAEMIMASVPGMVYHSEARMLTLGKEPVNRQSRGVIQVLCAGSSDVPVAEEAAVTAEFMGNRVKRFFDVGVAGLHRLLSLWEELQEASVYIVVAGMEGALPSVVGGLVERPVIAVPTSVGYGANFNGLAALLGMLNTCAPGVSVVNIDNGFGAGYLAAIINQNSVVETVSVSQNTTSDQ
ncbi:MAG: nickel pincer cofactor biosynthesis protein LarB [Deltaproteobacteria bacterium]|jgi:NCAIR mutase (PurE)-related protein|nr:nickel pincer cofactor biosynthesis protein LarB [Deltaproteobacteria bacterium]